MTMDLKQLWDLPEPTDTNGLPPLEGNRSAHPLAALRRTLWINIAYGVAVSLAFLVIVFAVRAQALSALFAVVLAFSLWATWDTWRLLRSLGPEVSASGPVLGELRRHQAAFTAWMRTQQRVGRFVYPVSAAGGALWGAVMGSGEPLADQMQRPGTIVVVVLCIVLMTPLCIWGARWMFKVAFGTHLEALAERIAQLER
jgi:hypothetical protein